MDIWISAALEIKFIQEENIMELKDLIGEFAFVAKVNVSNLSVSREWYKTKLGLKYDPRYDTPTWAQFSVPSIKRTAIGLNLDPSHTGSSGAVSTFVVEDIVAAREALIDVGVVVGPVIDVGHDVKLAFFKDPDGNSLGLRQNPSSCPGVAAIGA